MDNRTAFIAACERGEEPISLFVRALWDQPYVRLQMAGAVPRCGPARAAGAQPGAASPGAGDHAGDCCRGGGLARAASHMGSQEVAGAVAGGPAGDMLAGGEHAGGSVAARGLEQTAAAAAAG